MTNLPTAQPAATWRMRALHIGSIVLALTAIATLLVSMNLREDRANIGRAHDRLADIVMPADQVIALAGTSDPRILNEVRWAPGGERDSRAVVCVETSISSDALIEALGNLELVWVASGQEKARVAVDEAVRAPRYGLDRRCLELEAVELDLAEPPSDTAEVVPATLEDAEAMSAAGDTDDLTPPDQRSGYRVVLAGELDVVARQELGDARVTSMVVDSRSMSWYERAAVLALMLAMVMRLLLWQSRAPVRLVKSVWGSFDPLLAVAGAFVLTVVVSSLVGVSYDAGLMSFSTAKSIDDIAEGTHVLGPSDVDTFLALLFANAAVFAGVAWGVARLRTRETATALRTVHTHRFGILYPLLGGVALAIGASLLLTRFQPDQTSHMQWMTSMPGTLLATAAFACLSPWFEELFFRGVVFSSVEGVASRHWAAAISVALFLLAHVPQHLGFLLPLIPILIVAGLCTWLRYASGSTTPAFALHLGYNALLVLPALLV